MTFASDSTHWYASDHSPELLKEVGLEVVPGEAVYEVPYAKKEGMRDATLRDARKFKLCTSVTSVLGLWPKEGLHKARLEKVMTFLIDRRDSDKKVRELLLKHSKGDWKGKQGVLRDLQDLALSDWTEAAEDGTAVHESFDQFISGRDGWDRKHTTHIQNILTELDKIDSEAGWISEGSFSHSSGYGGKVDLRNERNIVDLKGWDSKKNFDTFLKYKETNPMQLAAYAVGTDQPKSNLWNIFFDRKTGECRSHQWGEASEYYPSFLTCLNLWKKVKNYDPRYAPR